MSGNFGALLDNIILWIKVMDSDLNIFHLEINRRDSEDLYVIGLNLEKTGAFNEAMLLYKFGAHVHDPMCMTRLADLLSEPPGYRDVGAAESLYKRACLAGYHVACANLAIMYRQLGKTMLSQKYMKIARDCGDPWSGDDN